MIDMKKQLFLWVLVLLTIGFGAKAQVKIGDNPNTVDPHSLLELESTTMGLLIPRMTQLNIGAISSPPTGLLVYQTDGTPGFYYYNGTGWVALQPANSGTVNYISKFTGTNATGNSLLFDNGTTVGLGTITPTASARFHVSGVGAYSNIVPYYQAGIVADGGGTFGSSSGIYGEGGWKGVYGRNPGIGSGSQAIGVHGRCEGSLYTKGYGVLAEAAGTGPTNYGIYASASGAATNTAGYFDGGASGYGVIVAHGRSGFGTTTPIDMSVVHVSGIGTYGVAPYYQAGIVVDGASATITGSGVYAEGGWRGVFGRNPGTAAGVAAIGVHGRCEGGNYTSAGYGVLAEAVGTGPTNYGIYANASGALYSNYGIYATSSGSGFAGKFSGNVQITGSISKGSGTFLIDHPLDPENKYLYHSFVESPDMMNVYNGNIVTDANGDATVTLPDYFEALNKDFRYQLTVIGVFAQAIVAEEIGGNQFKIKTDKPNVKVSWQVTGIRHDKFADAHRVVPEVEKEPQYKGYYLHAAEWNQPESKSIDHLTKPKVNNESNAPEGRGL